MRKFILAALFVAIAASTARAQQWTPAVNRTQDRSLSPQAPETGRVRCFLFWKREVVGQRNANADSELFQKLVQYQAIQKLTEYAAEQKQAQRQQADALKAYVQMYLLNRLKTQIADIVREQVSGVLAQREQLQFLPARSRGYTAGVQEGAQIAPVEPDVQRWNADGKSPGMYEFAVQLPDGTVVNLGQVYAPPIPEPRTEVTGNGCNCTITHRFPDPLRVQVNGGLQVTLPTVQPEAIPTPPVKVQPQKAVPKLGNGGTISRNAIPFAAPPSNRMSSTRSPRGYQTFSRSYATDRQGRTYAIKR